MTVVVGACLVIAMRLVTRATGVEAPHPNGIVATTEEAGAPDAEPLEETEPERPATSSGYDLNKPDRILVLPKTLDEISGLSLSKEPDSLWVVNDERPTLFRISTKDGEVIQEVDLKQRGDYESVEEVDDKVYVGRSEGAVMVVDPVNGGDPQYLDFKERLGLACDMEGIAYEPRRKRLLLSCKNEGAKHRKTKKAFEIYSMPIRGTKLHREPAFVLQEASIDDYIKAHPEQTDLKGFYGKNFAPSGLAVNPKTGNLYILSTRAKMLVVLDDGGALARVDALDTAVYAQPEGIAFDADGTMYISNEAHGKRATLCVIPFVEPTKSEE